MALSHPASRRVARDAVDSGLGDALDNLLATLDAPSGRRDSMQPPEALPLHRVGVGLGPDTTRPWERAFRVWTAFRVRFRWSRRLRYRAARVLVGLVAYSVGVFGIVLLLLRGLPG